jgi:hypothetical protein
MSRSGNNLEPSSPIWVHICHFNPRSVSVFYSLSHNIISGDGATFGEVALMSDDCIRTASIIADERCELIVIDRDLYNRSVKNVLKKEFEDKSNFIANSPYFRGWAPKYKKQLAMALQKETLPYEGSLTKQGDPVEAIYFILT